MGTGYLTVNAETAPSTPGAAQARPYLELTTLRPAILNGRGETIYQCDRQPPSLLTNGGLVNWQAHTANAFAAATYSSTGGRAHFADFFTITNENASVQASRIDTIAAAEAGLPARYYARIKKITNAGKIEIATVLPGDLAFSLRGQIVRVTWYLRTVTGSSAVTMRLGLLALSSSGTVDTMPATFVSAHGATSVDPTWGTNLAAITPLTGFNSTAATGGATCTLSAGWTAFSATFLVPAGTQNLVGVIWSDGQIAINDEFGFGGVMLTLGAELAEYVPKDPVQDFEGCQRQYQTTFLPGTAPVQAAGVNTGEWTWTNGFAAALGNHSPQYRYPVPMRASPTLTTFNPASASAEVRDETAAADCTAKAVASATAAGFRVDYTGAAGSVVGGVAGLHFTADARI